MSIETPKTKSSKNAPQLTPPLAYYSHGRWVGDLLFIAGQGCRDPKTGREAGVLTSIQADHGKEYDIVAQTHGVFANLERVLETEGLTKADLIDVTVFLTDMADFQAMNSIWNEFFGELTPPCRTTVAVNQLPGKNFIEMKAIAARAR
jgi:2-aminomuconate deaminase